MAGYSAEHEISNLPANIMKPLSHWVTSQSYWHAAMVAEMGNKEMMTLGKTRVSSGWRYVAERQKIG